MTAIAGINDFDFLLDQWQIVNKRRKAHLLTDAPEQNTEAEWEEFRGINKGGLKYLGGRVLMDFYDATFPDGQQVQGITIRTFDYDSHLWSIVWLDNRQPSDFRPLVGKFQDGVGEFFQIIETPAGKPLHVRFRWDNLSTKTARWQQSFSLDGGQKWDTNWIMEFTR
jgi:hypothetical protein